MYRFHFSQAELNTLKSKSHQLEMLVTEQKSKGEMIDELNKEIAEKNKVTSACFYFYDD